MRPWGLPLQLALAKPSSCSPCLTFSIAHIQRCPQLHQLPRLPRCFHASPACCKRSTSKYPSISQSSVERITSQRISSSVDLENSSDHFTPYSIDEKAELAKKYSPAQLASIDAGEAAISERDLATQGKLRRDPFQFAYLDDFSRIEQTIDKKIEKLRGEGQDYETGEGHPLLPHGFSTFAKAAAVEREAEIENVGEWVPARPSDPKDQEQLHQGPLTKLELRRTPYQIAKAALKEYLGTATVKEAIEYCWRRDIDSFGQEQDKFDAQPAEGKDTDISSQNGLPYLDLNPLHSDSDRPVDSSYFENTIFPDQRYQDIFRRIQDNPPPAKHFGTPAVDTKVREIFDPPLPDVAPEIPKIDDPAVRWHPIVTSDEDARATLGLDDDSIEAYLRLSKSMGQSISELRKYRVKTISRHRVFNQTRLGKIESTYQLCVAGNERGMVGLGEGKAGEPDEAGRIARLKAIRNMVPILRYENRTIYGEVSAKVGAAQVKLSARQPGFGLRTSRHIFEIAKCAGLADLSARVTRSRNPMNVAKAVWEALKSQKDPEDIARARGKKFVDVRKVYYSGLV